jgi:hypothetical protein
MPQNFQTYYAHFALALWAGKGTNLIYFLDKPGPVLSICLWKKRLVSPSSRRTLFPPISPTPPWHIIVDIDYVENYLS